MLRKSQNHNYCGRVKDDFYVCQAARGLRPLLLNIAFVALGSRLHSNCVSKDFSSLLPSGLQRTLQFLVFGLPFGLITL